MLSGRELIECLRELTDAERREIALLLRPALAGDTFRHLAGKSGVEAQSAFLASLTPQQRREIEKVLLLADRNPVAL